MENSKNRFEVQRSVIDNPSQEQVDSVHVSYTSADGETHELKKAIITGLDGERIFTGIDGAFTMPELMTLLTYMVASVMETVGKEWDLNDIKEYADLMATLGAGAMQIIEKNKINDQLA